jgi:hypothetical protein
LSSTLTTVPAWADDADVSPAALVAARELFREATQDFDAGRYAQALEKFRRVASVKETASVRFNIAQSEEKLGMLGSALADYELVQREAANDPGARDTVAAARDRATQLRLRVPRLVLRWKGDTPPDTVVTLDGKRVSPATFGVPLPVDPGPHIVEAYTGGQLTFRKEVLTAVSTTEKVEIAPGNIGPVTAPPTALPPPSETPHELPPPEEPPTPATGEKPPGGETPVPPVEESAGSSRRTIGWVLTGTGVVLAGASVFFTISNQGNVSDAKELCPTSPCRAGNQARYAELQDAAGRDRTLAVVFGAGALAAIGAGVYLLVTAKPSDAAKPSEAPAAQGAKAAPKPSAQLSFSAPGSLAGLSVLGRF